MITFIVGCIILITGYFLYSKVIEKIFGIEKNKPTPAYAMQDGVDYMPMNWRKVFLIQFLNIAGLGPIFGAVAGAAWGPIAFIWIALGSVFAGAVHDYFSGMISLRFNGLSITEVVGKILGIGVKQFMRGFTVILMIIVGAVFIMGPAKIIDGIAGEVMGVPFWAAIVFIYYVIATMLPIDKVIGRVYPVFGIALLFMALSVIVALVLKGYQIPELNSENFMNMHADSGKFPVFPMLFITIACGAISGFHSTQSPLMARCLQQETQGRRVFYGAMIAEGLVAMIWAAVAMAFFGGVESLNDILIDKQGNAAWIVNEISNTLLGKFGAILALLGVVAAPITSGDTAFRGARLIVADFTKLNQNPIKNRLIISIPLFVVGFALTLVNFGVIWRYFAWTNQTLAMIVLWAVSVYLFRNRKAYIVTLIPALFMTMVTVSYIFIAPEGFQFSYQLGFIIASMVTVIFLTSFFLFGNRK